MINYSLTKIREVIRLAKRLTDEQFKARIAHLFPHIDVLDCYVNNTTKLRFHCNDCGFEWKTSPAVIRTLKYGCPRCGREKESRSISSDSRDVAKRVHEKFSWIDYVSGYVNSHSKCKWFCHKCNKYFERSLSEVIASVCGCPYYGQKIKGQKHSMSNEEFVKRLNAKHFQIKPLEEYKGLTTKIWFKCLICGSKFQATPSVILYSKSRPGCRKCTYQSVANDQIIDHDETLDEIYKVNPNVILLDNFQFRSDKVRAKCRLDGFVWLTSPRQLLTGAGCHECAFKSISKSRKTTVAEIRQRIHSINTCIDILCDAEFVTFSYDDSVYNFIYRSCGLVWQESLGNFLRFCRCPYCSSNSSGSIPEQFIKRQFKMNFVLFKSPFIPGKSLMDKGPLHYDFKVGHFLIEYQGMQHYRPATFGRKTYQEAVNRFQVQKKHDQMKRKWAREHKFDLIEIPYNKNILDYLQPVLDEYRNTAYKGDN